MNISRFSRVALLFALVMIFTGFGASVSASGYDEEFERMLAQLREELFSPVVPLQVGEAVGEAEQIFIDRSDVVRFPRVTDTI